MTQSPPTGFQNNRSVAIHIGAHKTATTHMQQSLEASEDRLAAQGVRFYGPKALRKENQSLIDVFNLQVDHHTPKPTRSKAEQLEHMLGDGHRLVLSNENFIVSDVKAQNNYISCGWKVKSEIVIPIFLNGKNIGQIDIDSHTINPFTKSDEILLEFVCEKVSDLL